MRDPRDARIGERRCSKGAECGRAGCDVHHPCKRGEDHEGKCWTPDEDPRRFHYPPVRPPK